MTALLMTPARDRARIHITPHFTWSEVEGSATATRLGVPNALPMRLEPMAIYTALHMETVREVLNDVLDITSWYRSPTINRAVGSTDRSAHLLAGAVDFIPRRTALDEAYDLLRRRTDLPYDQLIIETDRRGTRWIHIGWIRPPRGDRLVAVWDRVRRAMTFERRTAAG